MPIVTIGENSTDTFSGVEDTFLSSTEPTVNKSASGDLSVSKFATGDHAHTLIRFPGLSNLPSGITVATARINLNILFLGVTAGYEISAKRILRTTVMSQATWNIYSTSNNWQTAGGLGSADRAATNLATFVMTGSEVSGAYLAITGAALAQAVEDVVNGVTADLVIHLERTDGADDEEFLAFASSEDGNDGVLPYLYVDYELANINTIVAEDIVVVSDANIYGILRYRAANDSVIITEGSTDLSTIFSGLTDDGFTMLDFTSHYFHRNRLAEDIVAMADMVTKVLRFTTIATDVLVTTEGETIFMTVWEVLVTESIDLVDEYLRRMLFTRLGSDSIVTIDNFISSATGQQIISALAEDLIAVTSQAFANLYRNRSLDDVVSLVDSRDQLTLRSVMASSVVEVLDQAVMQFIRVVELTDTFSLIDNVAALLLGTVVVDPSAIRIGVNQPNIVLGGYVV